MTDTSTEADQAEKTGGRRALGTMLVEKGLLESAQLEEALRIGEGSGERLGEVIVRLNWVSEEDLAKVLAEQWQLRYLDRSGISFDADALRRLSREEATRLEALPMHIDRDGVLAVALAEPTEARLLALRDLLGDHIQAVVVPKTALDLGLRGSLLASRGNGAEEAAEPEAEAEEVEEAEAAEPFVKLVAPVVTTPVIEPRDLAGEFDAAAKSIVEDLTSRLEGLRGVVDDSMQSVVDEAQATHDRDRGEIARLQDEIAQRDDTISQRDDTIQQRDQTIREMKDALRTFADNF